MTFTFKEEGDMSGLAFEEWPVLAYGGHYDTVETAEREARAVVNWLNPNAD